MLGMKKVFLLIGGPGSGKTSTMSALQPMNISHFSIGAMYRELSEQNSDLGGVIKSHINSGQVVPIKIAQQVIEHFIDKGKNTIVIDGFPRDMEQLQMFNNATKGKAELINVIELMVNEQVALERISKRARGTDDDPKLFKERMRVYEHEIEAIRVYYKSHNKYISLESNTTLSETAEKLRAILSA